MITVVLEKGQGFDVVRYMETGATGLSGMLAAKEPREEPGYAIILSQVEGATHVKVWVKRPGSAVMSVQVSVRWFKSLK